MGDLAAALDDLNRSIEIEAAEPNTYSIRGGILLEMGELEAAVADFDRALDLNEAHVGALAGRGLALAALGDVEGARRDLRAALSLIVDPGLHQTIESVLADLET